MTRETKTKKLADYRIEHAYRLACAGLEVNILDIPKIFAYGHLKIAAGANDDELQAGLRAYVEALIKMEKLK